MKKEEIYRLLSEKMLNYRDYVGLSVKPNGEVLLPIPITANLYVRQIDSRMFPLTKDQIYVRQTVLEKLLEISSLLESEHPELTLEVVYGYRTLEIQRELFEKKVCELKGCYNEDSLFDAVHKYIAVPEVAGHPTGGAIDVQLLKGQSILDFGTKIWEFVEDSLVFSPFISKEAWHNRQMLRRLMMMVGFAPFDGEWWHFSYGDKEWAKYYGKQHALYEQIDSSRFF